MGEGTLARRGLRESISSSAVVICVIQTLSYPAAFGPRTAGVAGSIHLDKRHRASPTTPAATPSPTSTPPAAT